MLSRWQTASFAAATSASSPSTSSRHGSAVSTLELSRCGFRRHSRRQSNMPTDLENTTPQELKNFIDSFDVVLSDCDGVLWWILKPIPGAVEVLVKLQKMGKKIYLVTNNSTTSTEIYREKLRLFGFDLQPEQLINTAKVIAWYLRKMNFEGEVYALASASFNTLLKDKGIDVISHPEVVPDNHHATMKAIQDRPSVKAVITDFDINCNWAKLTFALSCLQRDEVLYINGALDEWITCDETRKILGPGPLTSIVTNLSGKVPIKCAKPSSVLKEYVYENCEIIDPQRCLFIGDTIDHDMKFAKMCDFLKLFVATGNNTIEEALTQSDASPDYYLPNLGDLNSAIDDLLHANSFDGENS